MSSPSTSLPLPQLTGKFSLALLPQVIPPATVAQVLADTGKTSQRRRALPTDFLTYYIIALALFMQDSCREVLRRVQADLRGAVDLAVAPTVAGKAAITQARTKLGPTALQTLYERLVTPRATPETRGAWYHHWRIVSFDGTTLATPNSTSNAAAFGHSGSKHGPSAFPLASLVTLVEAGTHVIFGAAVGAWRDAETTLARQLLPRLTPEMLLLVDRFYYGHAFWQEAAATGAALLWRVKKNLTLPVEQRLPDGSYLSTTNPPHGEAHGHRVRVIEYQLTGKRTVYRLITNLLDPTLAPAHEVAALYHERWEHEGTLKELKTHLRGGAEVRLRSESADLVHQEIYGLLLAHYAVRSVMHDAAREADEDPDRLSFIHTVRVLRRKLPQLAALPPSALVALVGGGAHRSVAGARLLQSRPERPTRHPAAHQSISHPPRRAHRRTTHRLSNTY
jgi:hypothetical protein